jgi:hypothetical protein
MRYGLKNDHLRNMDNIRGLFRSAEHWARLGGFYGSANAYFWLTTAAARVMGLAGASPHQKVDDE